MGLSLIVPPAQEPVTEAELARNRRVDLPNVQPAPSVAPTVAVEGSAGTVTAGSHRLAISFIDGEGGETTPGPLSDPIAVTDPSTAGQLSLTGIPVGGATVAKRRIWMTRAGGVALLLAGEVADHTTTTATVNVADADLVEDAPTENTTRDADPELASVIPDARERCEALTHRQFIKAQYQLTAPCWPYADGFIEVPRPPLMEVASIRYLDTAGVWQTWATDQYEVSAPKGQMARRGRIRPAYGVSWPSLQDALEAVEVTFWAGYGPHRGDVPGTLKRAVKLMAGSWYEQRENDVLERQTTAIPKMSGRIEAILLPFRSRPETRQVY